MVTHDSNPSIVVLVLTYNHEKFIEQALRSVLAQECEYPIHITIHDDQSTDSTRDIVKDIMSKSPHSWDLLVPKKNRFSQGMNFVPELLQVLDSDFIAVLEGDDYWTDTAKLQLQAEALIANPNASICHHTFSVREFDSILHEWPPQKWRYPQPGTALAEENFIGTLTTMLRRSDIPNDFGPGFNGLSIADYPIWALISDDKEIEFVDRNMATYRIHDSNYWANGSDGEKSFQTLRAKIYIASTVQVKNANHWIGFISKQLKSEIELELARSTELNEKFSKELEDRAIAIENIYDSFSWRITRPTRKLASLFKKTLLR